jgi:hypothetical protein
VLDAYTRECVALEVATHFHGSDVARVLTRISAQRERSAVIACDSGTRLERRASWV